MVKLTLRKRNYFNRIVYIPYKTALIYLILSFLLLIENNSILLFSINLIIVFILFYFRWIRETKYYIFEMSNHGKLIEISYYKYNNIITKRVNVDNVSIDLLSIKKGFYSHKLLKFNFENSEIIQHVGVGWNDELIENIYNSILDLKNG